VSAARSLAASSEALRDCVARGGVAVFPTDTVYGLCCDPENPLAVGQVYALKGRAADKPAALLCFSLAAALSLLDQAGERTRAAISALLPGPLTVLLANPQRRFPLAGGQLLGLRVIDNGLSLATPVLQSSANHAGGRDARRLADVPATIRDRADLVIDGGELPGVPSTVLDLSTLEDGGGWRILRPGAFAAADIARVLDEVVPRRW
jgi:L-threonylcarbamoyladenylate synthase